MQWSRFWARVCFKSELSFFLYIYFIFSISSSGMILGKMFNCLTLISNQPKTRQQLRLTCWNYQHGISGIEREFQACLSRPLHWVPAPNSVNFETSVCQHPHGSSRVNPVQPYLYWWIGNPWCHVLCDFNANSCTSFNGDPGLDSNCVSHLAASAAAVVYKLNRLPVFVTAAHHHHSLSLERTLIGPICAPTN